MQLNLEQLWQQFNQLSQREKLMAIFSILLVVWGAWDNFFYQSLASKNQQIETEISSLQTQISAKQQAIKELSALIVNNPNDHTRQQLSELQQSVGHLKNQLNVGDKKFVSANLMAGALSDMLKQQGVLKLVKLQTLPVTSFPSAEEKDPWIFRHTLVITVQGDFFSTLNYLKSLETLPWRIYWESINYQVKDYPIAETRIQVYTLSFEKDWLGV